MSADRPLSAQPCRCRAFRERSPHRTHSGRSSLVAGTGPRCGRAARITLFLRREPSWRRRSLAAGLLACCAEVSGRILARERGALSLGIGAGWGMSLDHAGPPRTGSSVEQARPSSVRPIMPFRAYHSDKPNTPRPCPPSGITKSRLAARRTAGGRTRRPRSPRRR